MHDGLGVSYRLDLYEVYRPRQKFVHRVITASASCVTKRLGARRLGEKFGISYLADYDASTDRPIEFCHTL